MNRPYAAYRRRVPMLLPFLARKGKPAPMPSASTALP